MKKIGIAANQYKIPRFRQKLEEAGYKITVTPGKQFTAITMHVPDEDFDRCQKEVLKICQEVELYYKRSN